MGFTRKVGRRQFCILLVFVSILVLRFCLFVHKTSISSSSSRQLVIAFGTTVYGEQPVHWNTANLLCPLQNENSEVVELNVTFMSKTSHKHPADAVVYHGPDLARLVRSKSVTHSRKKIDDFVTGPVNIYYTEEPPFASLVHGSQALELDDIMMQNFHVYAGFNPSQLLSRDGHICYNGWAFHKWRTQEKYDASNISSVWRSPLPYSQRRTDYHAAWVTRNCRVSSNTLGHIGPSPRVSIIRALMENMDIASFGDCLRNAQFPADMKQHSGFGNGKAREQDEYLRHFKFILAFENNLCDVYVRENMESLCARSDTGGTRIKCHSTCATDARFLHKCARFQNCT